MPTRILPALAACALAAAPAQALHAQVAAPVEAIVQPALAGGGLALTAGLRWTRTPAPGEGRVDPDGTIVPAAARPSLQLLATGGVTFARPRGHTPDLTALGSVSVQFPRGSGPIRGWGPALLASFNPTAAGPGVRAETAFGAVGVQAGALWHLEGPRRRSAAIGVDVSVPFITDIFRR
jgi:hypothetical protein